ncbi:MAG: aminopeptidase P family protein [Lachnospiraceae bacterium]|nr:aminopeptidase P family protein [Lachnospiraceae bacterium]
MKAEITALRQEMEKEGFVAYVVPTNDYHGSEYVADFFKERAYVSGFTGSAGTLVVTGEFAGLWTDGRYFLQAEKELDGSGITLMKMGEPEVPTVESFLSDTVKEGEVIAFDGKLVSAEFVNKLKEQLPSGVSLSMKENLVDRIWTDRPKLVRNPIFALKPEQYGEARKDKLERMRKALSKKEADATFLTSLEDIAWLLNLRGTDIHCNLVFLSYLYLTGEEAVLFTGPEDPKEAEEVLPGGIKEALKKDGVTVRPYEEVYAFAEKQSGKRVYLDEASVNAHLAQIIGGSNEIVWGWNVTYLPKAIKNETELRNMRKAHVKDGVALTKLLYGLKMYRDAVVSGREPDGAGVLTLPPTELSLAEDLVRLRRAQGEYIEESFDPIMGYGPHGAVIHYSADEESNVGIGTESLFLSDTGGHYEMGTTDVTRTISMAPKGELSAEAKEHYTLVLKSHLALLSAKFPKGVTGNSLDALAREPLWQAGLDFNHGTGHGVGYMLSVHEGPNAFRTYRGRGQTDKTAIVPGMITSDEPGLYFAGKYGIRLESLLECVEEENGFYGFRALTMVPFDVECIDFKLLNIYEKRIFFDYQKKVYDTIGTYLTDDERAWLKGQITEPEEAG